MLVLALVLFTGCAKEEPLAPAALATEINAPSLRQTNGCGSSHATDEQPGIAIGDDGDDIGDSRKRKH